jgi:membrane-associated protease RseP (regulator of RpoE activity)
MWTTTFRVAARWALAGAMVVFGAASIAAAQNDQGDLGGPVIQIGKSDPGENNASNLQSPGEGLAPEGQPGSEDSGPKFWIGLVGGPIDADHPLRAHVDIPENQGLLVVNVVPNSPASKAGLKQNDILLRANDNDLSKMEDLVQLVTTEGEKKGQIAIEVLRRGERETVYVTPEERPADAQAPQGSFGQAFGPGFAFPGGGEIPQDLLREFRNLPFEFRQFGPGVVVGGDEPANLPNGVSVSIVQENGQPAKITVQRGGETWHVNADDPGSLNQLPEDLRPFVEKMIRGRTHFGMSRPVLPELGNGRLSDRLDRMEERMQKLQERLEQRLRASQPADSPQHDAADTN